MTESLRALDDVPRATGPAPAPRMPSRRSASTSPGNGCGQFPHELSGGMLQRVMIATALLAKPRLLLADECTTALDVTTQAEVMAILDDLRRDRGLSMLFITHDLELAGAVCDRTSVMYAGQVVETERRGPAPRRPAAPVQRGTRRRPGPTSASTAERLVAIPGRPVSAFEAPPGCRVRAALPARPRRLPQRRSRC